MLEKDRKAPRQHPYLTRHPSRRPAAGPEPDERAWRAQARLYHRHKHLTEHGKRSTVANVAIAPSSDLPASACSPTAWQTHLSGRGTAT